MAVELDNIVPFDVPAPIAYGLIHESVKIREQHGLPVLIQRKPVRHAVKILRLNFSPGKEVHDDLFGPNAVTLDQVEDQRFFIIMVRVNKAHVRVEPGDDARLLHLGIEHAVGIIEQRVELVLRRVPAPAVELEPVGHKEAQCLEIHPAAAPLDPHDAATVLVNLTGEAVETGGDAFDLVDISRDLGILLRPRLPEPDEQIGLVRGFRLHPSQGQGEPVFLISDFELSPADGRGAPELRVPHPAIGVPVLVNEHNIDVVLHGHFDRIGRDVSRRGDQYGRNLFARDLEDLLVVPDLEAVPVLLEIRAVCVDHELHGKLLSL